VRPSSSSHHVQAQGGGPALTAPREGSTVNILCVNPWGVHYVAAEAIPLGRHSNASAGATMDFRWTGVVPILKHCMQRVAGRVRPAWVLGPGRRLSECACSSVQRWVLRLRIALRKPDGAHQGKRRSSVRPPTQPPPHLSSAGPAPPCGTG